MDAQTAITHATDYRLTDERTAWLGLRLGLGVQQSDSPIVRCIIKCNSKDRTSQHCSDRGGNNITIITINLLAYKNRLEINLK